MASPRVRRMRKRARAAAVQANLAPVVEAPAVKKEEPKKAAKPAPKKASKKDKK